MPEGFNSRVHTIDTYNLVETKLGGSVREVPDPDFLRSVNNLRKRVSNFYSELLNSVDALASDLELLSFYVKHFYDDWDIDLIDVVVNTPEDEPADTHESYVYFIEAEKTGFIKIGKANDVEKRLNSLQTANPVKLTLLGKIRFESSKMALAFESFLHNRFRYFRESAGERRMTEWFDGEIKPYVLEIVNGGSDLAKNLMGADAQHPSEDLSDCAKEAEAVRLLPRIELAKLAIMATVKPNERVKVCDLNSELERRGVSAATARRAKESLVKEKKINVTRSGGAQSMEWFIERAG